MNPSRVDPVEKVRTTRRLPVAAVLGATAVLALSACGSPPDPQSVTLLAGGGSDVLNARRGTPAQGTDVDLDGPVMRLSGRGDGTVWGLLDHTFVLSVDSDGTVRQQAAATESGDLVELVAVAAAPDGTVYVLPSDVGEIELGADAAVYTLDDDNVVRPAVGEDGEYGPVTAIAVDPEGRVLFVENVGDASPGANQFQPHQVRRVEPGGSITTVAGATEVSDGGPSSDDYQAWIALPDGTPASEIPLYMHTALAVGGDGAVYLASGNNVAAISEDGTLRHVAGGGPAQEGAPPLPLDTAFGEPVSAAELAYSTLAPRAGANAAGDVVSSFLVDSDEFGADDVVSWDVDRPNDATQGVVDAAWEARPFMMIQDGDAMLASALGHTAAWLDDDTIAIAAGDDDGRSIVVAVDVPDRSVAGVR